MATLQTLQMLQTLSTSRVDSTLNVRSLDADVVASNNSCLFTHCQLVGWAATTAGTTRPRPGLPGVIGSHWQSLAVTGLA